MKPCTQAVGSLFFWLGSGQLIDVLDTHFYNPDKNQLYASQSLALGSV
jgi:hypothetical protein